MVFFSKTIFRCSLKLYRQDFFYEANGTHSLFGTCNAWTGRGLKTMDIKIGVWTPFQGGIMKHLE